MWIFTKFGFYSVVSHWQNPDTLIVRGRVSSDFDRLLDRVGSTLQRSKDDVVVDPDADYRYRIFVDRSLWSRAMSELSADIDYSNFKNEVQKFLGEDRADACHAVWDIMYEFQEREENIFEHP